MANCLFGNVFAFILTYIFRNPKLLNWDLNVADVVALNLRVSIS
jgi:hypothetical protein